MGLCRSLFETFRLNCYRIPNQNRQGKGERTRPRLASNTRSLDIQNDRGQYLGRIYFY